MTNCEIRALFPDIDFRYADCDTMPGQIPDYLREFANEGFFGHGPAGCGHRYIGCPDIIDSTPICNEATPVDSVLANCLREAAANSANIIGGCRPRPRRRRSCRCCCCCCCCGGGGGDRPIGERCNFPFSVKNSINGEPIVSAVFDVNSTAGDTQTAFSDATGKVNFQLLPNVDYTLTQSSAPLGMQVMSGSHTIRVDNNCVPYVDGVMNTNFTVVNEPLAPLTVDFSFLKLDQSTMGPVNGAIFTLTSTTQGTVTAFSDETGVVAFNRLTPGSYILREVFTPAGYIPNTRAYIVTISDGGEILVDNTSAQGFYVTNIPL